MNNDRPLCSPFLRRVIALVALVCSVALSSPLLAVDAGRFMVVVGDVRVVNENGQSQPAIRGSLLSSGDTVVTGKNALAQLSMVDNGRISLRENTEFKLDEYNFKQEEPSAGRMFVNLLRGSFRSLTGLIGTNNRAGYRVRTPHATLGVRGTDHETTVILAPREGFDPGTFDVVFQGRTVLRTAQGQIEISPRQAGYVAASNAVPRIVKIPTFLEAAPSARAPAPQTGAARSRAAAKPAAGASDTSNAAKNTVDRKAILRNPLSSPRTGSTGRVGAAPTKGGSIGTSPLRTPISPSSSTLLRTPMQTTVPTTKGNLPSVGSALPSTSPTTTSPLLRTPTTTLSPTLTAPKTTISPTMTAPTTTISPTLTSPTRTISPTLTAPTTTISPKITAPTTTTSPTLTAPKTTISPTLTSPTR